MPPKWRWRNSENPNIQLLIKDDAGNPQGAQQATQQALDEGAEIILGPLFAVSVPAAAQLTRTRGVSMIAFLANSSVAGRGVYLLSFLPESDVAQIIEYSASTGKRSYAALLPENAYGNVVEAFVQAGGGPQGRSQLRTTTRRTTTKRLPPITMPSMPCSAC